MLVRRPQVFKSVGCGGELGWRVFALGANPYELQDGAQITPVSAFGARDCGLHVPEIFFLEVTLGILSLLGSWIIYCL
jgi:hypothetical protein